MYKNLGSSDRLIRFVLMDFLLGFSLSGIDLSPWLANACFMLSMYLLLTMLAAYSPLYYLFGWDTKSAESITTSSPSPQ